MKDCPNCGATLASRGNGKYKCRCCGYEYTDPSYVPPKPVQVVTPIVTPIVEVTRSSGSMIYEKNINAVLEIHASRGNMGGSGTGFLISRDGIALTNVHVVTFNSQPADRIRVQVAGREVGAQIIKLGDNQGGHGNGIDVAIIKLDTVPANATCVKLGKSSAVKHGEQIYYIGNSKGEGLCITSGIVSDNARNSGGKTYIMTDAATNPGNSGGPLFNDMGEVIGIHVSARIDAVGMKYAIPIDHARNAFPTWVK